MQARRALAESGSFVVMNPPLPMGTELVASSPEVEQAVHVYEPGRTVVSQGAQRFYEEGLLFTEPAFFDVFDFPLLRGDPKTALARPGTVVLTPDAAHKYFGAADPVGRTLTANDSLVLEVTGVLRPVPSNTHLKFALLASMATFNLQGKALEHGQVVGDTRTYLLLHTPQADSTVIRQAQALMAKGDDFIAKAEPVLFPVKRLHFEGFSSTRDTALGGNMRYVYIFGSIALLVLLIACINFTNLTTAQALRRAREVGVRKVVGAGRAQLVGQFLGETVLFSLVAVLAAVALVEVALPFFNTLVGKELRVAYAGPGAIVPWLGALWIGTALLAGTYPAFVLSGFNPMVTLKGAASAGLRGGFLRRVLVVFQFTISIALLTGLFVIERQLDHLQRQSLKLQPDQVVLFGTHEQAAANFAAFKAELQKLPGVTSVTVSNFPNPFGIPTKIEGKDREEYISTLLVDPDFVQTLNLRLTAGRAFDLSRPTDVDGAVLINEAAAKAFGWTEPLGRKIERVSTRSGAMVTSEVVGVVEDFPVGSLKREMDGLVLVLTEKADAFGSGLTVLARLDAAQVPEALAALQALWPRFAPGHPFAYQFLDERFAEFYRAERQLGLLFGTFAGLAVLIACLGLFGLAVYTAERRTKEIGIRKVLGASIPNVVVLLSREFALLVAGAFVVATPLAYFTMNKWLQDFAYRIEMGPGLFILAGGLALAVALLTVSYQALRAALADPVKALRYE
jgi:putative ABC transport system permease protein